MTASRKKFRGRLRSGSQKPTAGLLRLTARSILPFLKAIAGRRGYAAAWSRAVVAGDLDRMTKLLGRVAPELAKNGLGTNGIGYFFSFPEPWSDYSCGTTIPPGSVQFHFSPVMHRLVAQALIPYYRRLLTRPAYALRLAGAIRRQDHCEANRLVKRGICSPLLRSVSVEDGEFRLTFKARSGKYQYDHLLFPFLD